MSYYYCPLHRTYLQDGRLITRFLISFPTVGTGGAPKYGVVAQMPVIGNVENPLADWALPRECADTAGLG